MQKNHASIVDTVLDKYKYQSTNLVQILREVQERTGWIYPEIIAYLTEKLAIPFTKITSVASFYAFLYLQPPGQYRILFSDNITDRMLGNATLIEHMCRNLWVELGKTSEDGLVSIDKTSCTGMCDQGPALLVNNIAITKLSEQRIDAICDLIRAKVAVTDWPSEYFSVTNNIQRSELLLEDDFVSGSALKAGLKRGAEGMIAELRLALLRGRGGAGFATATKWEACRKAHGEAHYVVCNADEGEPGTFKDRVLLNLHANKVFEGMTLCAQVIGAKKGMLYLRGEYRYLLDQLSDVLQQRRSCGLLGTSILGLTGFDFDIEIHMGAGAYICGEESALIESLEGKRGTPRNRPPFPVTSGYLNQPTVVNNVETFAASCHIALHGGAWYAGMGTARSAGTKIISVSGDCARPGVYEYSFGVSIRQVLLDCGASDTQAVQVGGPSGVTIGASEFDRFIAFEDVPSAGAFMIFNHARDMFEVARNFVHFFAHESCGFCTPCRVGTSLLRNLMDKLNNGHGSQYDFDEIEKLNKLLLATSHCGLGHTACNPVLDTIAKFRPAYERRLLHQNFQPAFDLDWSLQAARQMTGRDDSNAHLQNEVVRHD